MSIQSLKIQIPDSEVESLRLRLKHTRWAPPVESSAWAASTDAEYLRGLVHYWASEYDWREREARLNRFSHFIAEVSGTKLHFIRADGQGPSPMPLLLLQGWPSSFVQMLEIIPLLTEARADGTPCFDVVAASLPGYPFSDFPTEPGNPERLIGLHRSGITPFANPLPSDLSAAEVEYQTKVGAWAAVETAYARLQALRAETLTPALADSPVGLASWFIEKFQRWGDCAGDVDRAFGRDGLLDNLSLHWFTGAGAASIRLCREAALDPGLSGRVEVPTAILMPLRDGVTVPAPREWAERSFNVTRWTLLEHGGHFPEWEVPRAGANDIRQFFSELG